jgi:hypothetical protein
MNKKNLQYTVLMLFFVSINSSFAMDDNNNKKNGYSWQGIAIGAAIVTYTFLPYLSRKVVASRYEDASPETQKWVTKVLKESDIKDADQIPLKKGKNGQGWAAGNDYFIIVPNDFDPLKCGRQGCLNDKTILKHEVKHVQNYDATKRRVFEVGTVVAGLYLAKEKPLALVPFAPIGYGANMAYWKYQESEADRFAYEKATSREELVAAKNDFLQIRAQYEKELLQGYDDALLQLKALRAVNGMSENEFQSEQNNIFSMIRDKDIILDANEFIGDREHPSLKNRAAMAQDYINKWDAEHKEELQNNRKFWTTMFGGNKRS